MSQVQSELLIGWENWLLLGIWVLVIPMREAGVLKTITARGHVCTTETLAAYHFMISIVKYMIRRFAAFCGFVFLF